MKNSNYLIPFAIIGGLFFVLGFAVGINNILIPFLREAFDLTTTSSYLVMTATYSAFIIFGYPSGMIIKKIGYKKSIILSFFILALGMLIFAPSAKQVSFPLFLVALFVGGMGNTLLQAAVNPYVTILGPKDGGAKRLSIMGICNKLANAFAPLILAMFLNLKNVELNDIVTPFYILTVIMVLLGCISYFFPLEEVVAEGENETEEDSQSEVVKYVATKSSILQFPHLILGAVALFMDVGVEMIALGTIVDYANEMGASRPEMYTMYTTIFMVVGYILGALFIPKKILQQQALFYCSILGVFAAIMAVFTPAHISIWFVALMGLSNSLLWPSIWPLAITDLGKFTKTGSSVLVIAIVGGALVPLLFGWIADVFGDFKQAYWICVPIYLYLMFYAVKGYKLR